MALRADHDDHRFRRLALLNAVRVEQKEAHDSRELGPEITLFRGPKRTFCSKLVLSSVEEGIRIRERPRSIFSFGDGF
jgi:hypothetical protein